MYPFVRSNAVSDGERDVGDWVRAGYRARRETVRDCATLSRSGSCLASSAVLGIKGNCLLQVLDGLVHPLTHA